MGLEGIRAVAPRLPRAGIDRVCLMAPNPGDKPLGLGGGGRLIREALPGYKTRGNNTARWVYREYRQFNFNSFGSQSVAIIAFTYIHVSTNFNITTR